MMNYKVRRDARYDAITTQQRDDNAFISSETLKLISV